MAEAQLTKAQIKALKDPIRAILAAEPNIKAKIGFKDLIRAILYGQKNDLTTRTRMMANFGLPSINDIRVDMTSMLNEKLDDILELNTSQNIIGQVIGELYGNMLKTELNKKQSFGDVGGEKFFDIINEKLFTTQNKKQLTKKAQDKKTFYTGLYSIVSGNYNKFFNKEAQSLVSKELGFTKAKDFKDFVAKEGVKLAKQATEREYTERATTLGSSIYAETDTDTDKLTKLEGSITNKKAELMTKLGELRDLETDEEKGAKQVEINKVKTEIKTLMRMNEEKGLEVSRARRTQETKDKIERNRAIKDSTVIDKANLEDKLKEFEDKANPTVYEAKMIEKLKDRIEGEKALAIQEENNRIARQQVVEEKAAQERILEARRGKKAAAIQEEREAKEAAEEATKEQQKREKQEKIERLIAEQNEKERATLETRNRATKQTAFMDNYIGQMTDQGRAQRLQNAITKFGAINDPDPKHKRNRLNRLLHKFANPEFSAQDREIAGDLAVHLFGKDVENPTVLTEGTADATTNATIRAKLDRYRTELERTGLVSRTRNIREGKDIKGFLNRPNKDQELTNPQTPRQEGRQGREIAIAGRAMNEAVGGGGAAGESENDRQARVRADRLTESQYDSGGDRVGRNNEGIISKEDMDREYPRRVRPALGTTARQAETAKTVQRTAEYKRQWSAMGTTIRSMNLDDRLIKEIEGTEGLEGEQQRSVRESAINYRDTRRFIERNQGAINADFAQMAVNSGHLVGIGGEFGGNFYDADKDFAKGDYRQSLLDDIAAGNNVVQVYSNSMNLTTIPTTTRMARSYTAGQGGISLGNIASVVRAAHMDKIVYYAHTYPSGANFVQGIGMDINQPNIDTKATSAGNLKITDLRDKFPFTGREDYKSGSMFGREEVNLGTASNVVKIDALNLKEFIGPEFNGVILHKGMTRLDAWERRGRPEYIEAEGDPIGGGYVGAFDKLYVKRGKGFRKVADSVREGEYASGGFYSAAQDLANARRDQRIRQTKYLYPYKQKRPIATLRPKKNN